MKPVSPRPQAEREHSDHRTQYQCGQCDFWTNDRDEGLKHCTDYMHTIQHVLYFIGAELELQAEVDRKDAEIAQLRQALEAILAEPHGCVFCDSGLLRCDNPNFKSFYKGERKEHESDCGFAMARAALSSTTPKEKVNGN
jgi:hypothetical protein